MTWSFLSKSLQIKISYENLQFILVLAQKMMFTKLNIEPRQNPARHAQIKKCLKSKASLPETCSSAEAAFQDIKLTQSHDIQNLLTSEFQLNIIPPKSVDDQGEKLTKKFLTPQWLISSNILASVQGNFASQMSENPQHGHQDYNPSFNEYCSSKDQNQKAESQNGGDFLKVDKSQIQRILQMTVSDDRERQFYETNFKSHINSDDFESKSTFLNGCSSLNSEKINQSSLYLNKAEYQKLATKPKSAIFISENMLKDLENYYKKQYEILSEYGLKPCEQNRLRKIQQIQKMALLEEQGQNVQGQQSQQDQQYFNLSKSKKTIEQVQKFRKCSAALLTQKSTKNQTDLSKRSKSKQKHSLNKEKKFKTPQVHGSCKISSMKKICSNPGKK